MTFGIKLTANGYPSISVAKYDIKLSLSHFAITENSCLD